MIEGMWTARWRVENCTGLITFHDFCSNFHLVDELYELILVLLHRAFDFDTERLLFA